MTIVISSDDDMFQEREKRVQHKSLEKDSVEENDDFDDRFEDDELWLKLPSTQEMIKNRIKPKPSKFLKIKADIQNRIEVHKILYLNRNLTGHKFLIPYQFIYNSYNNFIDSDLIFLQL